MGCSCTKQLTNEERITTYHLNNQEDQQQENIKNPNEKEIILNNNNVTIDNEDKKESKTNLIHNKETLDYPIINNQFQPKLKEIPTQNTGPYKTITTDKITN